MKLQFCQNGVLYLSAMLSVRTDFLEPRSQVTTNDEDTFKLLSKGKKTYMGNNPLKPILEAFNLALWEF